MHKIDNNLRSIAKGGIIITLVILLGKALSFLYILLLSRLGPSNYGALSLGFSIFLFLIIISKFGLNEGTIRYVAYNLGKKDKAKIKGAITDPLRVTAIISIFLAIALFLLANKLAELFTEPLLIPILKIIAISLPFLATSSIFLGAITGFKEAHISIIIKYLIDHGTKLILTLFLFFFGYAIIGAIAAYVFAAIVVWIVSFYYLQKKIFPIIHNKLKADHYIKDILSYSWPLVLFAAMNTVIAKVDVLMLGLFKTTDIVGIYNVALPASELLYIIPAALMGMFFPIVTGIYAQNKDYKLLYYTVTKWIILLSLIFLSILMLFSKQILILFFNQEYITASQPLIILSIGIFFLAISHPNIIMLKIIKKTKLILSIILLAAIVNIILNYLLIPIYGMIGGAVATNLAYIIIFTLTLYFVYKFEKLNMFNKQLFKLTRDDFVVFDMIKNKLNKKDYK